MEEIFDSSFKSRGGLYKHESSNSVLKNANYFINHVKKIYPNLPNIYFNLINSNVINASVKKYKEDLFLIGVNIGLVNALDDLFLKLHSNKSAKPEDCSKLNLLNTSKGLEFTHPHLTTVLNFSEEDINISVEQNVIAFKFIIYHEICHILRGHVGLMDEEFDLNITEANDTNNEKVINIMQTLEMDSDSFATNRSINDFYLRKSLNKSTLKVTDKDIETYIYNYAYSIYCFFRIFGFYNLEISKIKSKTHPSPATRISMILDNIATIMINNKEKNKGDIMMKSIQAIHDAETDLMKVTFYDNQIGRFMEFYTDKRMNEYKLKIAENWQEVKQKLEKHSYAKLPV